MATVLVVDDVAMNREMVCTLLGYRGHRVVEASGGDEALSMARQEHPDVVVTDVLMPGMDGYELARWLRSDPVTARAALVFYSANYSEHELQPAMQDCGVHRLVSKAEDPQLLLDAVDAVLAEAPDTSTWHLGTDLDLGHVHAVNAKLVAKVRQLSASEERFRVMAQSSPVGIFLVDADGNTTYVNERLQAIMGAGEYELAAGGWLRCFSPGLRDDVLGAVIRAERLVDVEHRCRTRLVRPDGQTRWLNTHLRAMRDEEGRSAGAVGMVDDVTAILEADERLRAETRRAELDARLRASQRLDSLRRLAGGVAHDYNNLLAVIQSFGAFVTDAVRAQAAAGRLDGDAAAQMQSDLEQIQEAARRATGLSRQLQLFGSRAAFQPSTVDVNAVLDAEAGDVLALVGDEIELQLRLDPDVRPATADVEQVQQVLRALVANARDAMPDGGTLLIETTPLPVGKGGATTDDLAAGDYVRLTVKDTGCGMSEETRAHAIEPFYTTKPRGHGTGLGLATVYGIATQVGGGLRIESAPGAGTSVHFILPALRPAASPAPPGAASPGPGAVHTVLVVDDEEAVRELVARMLRKAGYQVLVAADGLHALALADQRGDEITCLLTDVVMPRMLGSELARRFSAGHPGVPVLFMSGYLDPMLETGDALGSELRVLAKPFTRAELLAMIQAAVRGGERP